MNSNTPVNILLVDDEPANLLALDVVLGNLGATLVHARSGEDALRQALVTDFAVILLDFYMPTMGGLEVAQIIRTRSANTPIIFITASGPEDFPVEEAYSLGAVDYLAKPYNPTVLRSKVAFFIELHKRTEALAKSERSRYLSELNIKEGRIRLILENAIGYSFIVMDPAGRITEWEGGAQAVTGWSPEEVIGQSIAIIFTEEDRLAGKLQAELGLAKKNGLAEDKRWHLRKDGTRFYADGVVVPLKDAADQFHGFTKIFRDATRERLAADEVRQGEVKLHESRTLFSLLLESSVDGIYGMGPDSSCTFLNVAGAAMLGYQPDELVGQPIHHLIQHHRVDGSDYPIAQSRIIKAVHDGIAVRVDDEVFWHKDGSPVPVSYSVSPIIAQGKPTGAVITFIDITERRRYEAEREQLLMEVQSAHSQMADIFKQAPSFMCILRGPDHQFEMANDRYLHLVGNRDIIGKSIRDALPEVNGQGFFELLDQVFITGQPFVGNDMPIALQRQPGAALETRFVDFVFMALEGAGNQVNGVLIHGVDQTDRRLAELAVRSNEERYRTLFESIDQGFCIIELLFDGNNHAINYKTIEMNPAYKKLSGVTAIPEIFDELPEPNQFWLDIYNGVSKTDKSTRFELRDASLGRWFDVLVTPMGIPGSRKLAVLSNDITDRKRIEENLRGLAADLSEADRRKSEFLATLAHELRNPLAPIRSGLEILRLHGTSLIVMEKTRNMMERQVDHMVHLVDDLLDIARISGGKIELKREPVALKDVVAIAIETSLPLIEAGRHEFIIDISDAPMVVDVDSNRIAQVVSNLLNNAAKYTLPGGRIELSVSYQGNDAVLVIRDNGIGIPEEALPNIFDMFNQVGRNMSRAQGGLGIGLSLVRQLVEMHGGAVSAASKSGVGSSFTVTIPIFHLEKNVPDKSLVETVSKPSPKLRILVVDDNVDAAETLAMLLGLGGHNIEVAHNGYAAVKLAAAFMPHVVFLDIGMPGMDGYETAAEIRKTGGLSNAVLIALTGWGTTADRARSAEAGFNHHFTKPVQIEAIDALLANIEPT